MYNYLQKYMEIIQQTMLNQLKVIRVIVVSVMSENVKPSINAITRK